MCLKIIQWSVVLVLFSSCIKEEGGPEIVVEPPEPIEVKIDSILTGSLYNVTIGTAAEEVYTGLQGFTNARGKIQYLGIVGLLNMKVTDLKDRIVSYNSLILDQKPSVAFGGQIYFKGDKIESIYFRNGAKTSSWPNNANDPLRVGDPVATIYDKLIQLEKDSRFTRFFEYIGMFEKNMDRPFDAFQSRSNKWQFSIVEDDKNFIRVDLEFKEAKLVKIRSRHERYL